MQLNLPKPTPRQEEFLLANEKFVAYGGSRGGGKSFAIRIKAIILALSYPGIKILFLRRTLTDLKENHIIPMQSLLKDCAIWKEMDKYFLFPNGSRIKFGYCDAENDVLHYQGQEFDVVFIDEATQMTEFQYNILTTCIRGANEFPKRMYLTCNPGGVGHKWVKRLFIDRDFKDTEVPEDYRFIPAKLSDNKPLMEKNPDYLKQLENLPPKERQAWLNGDWNFERPITYVPFREMTQPKKQLWNTYF